MSVMEQVRVREGKDGRIIAIPARFAKPLAGLPPANAKGPALGRPPVPDADASGQSIFCQLPSGCWQAVP
jgi:hypothetical protein